ncbi:MAG: DUF3696 domain-containing protein [Candidatus Omnitrophota bacterium]
MITELHLQNFKSWKDTGPMKFAPLTGFFGTNSTGKSSILQALLMMKQTVESSDRSRVLYMGDERSLVDLGTYYDIVNGHNEDASLEISISWNLLEPLDIYDLPTVRNSIGSINSFSFHTSIKEEAKRLLCDRFEYSYESKFGRKKPKPILRIAEQKVGMERKRESSDKKAEYEFIYENIDPLRSSGRPWPLPSPVKFYGFPDVVFACYQNLGSLGNFVLEFEKLFSKIAYLGPLREYPNRIYVWAGNNPIDVGKKGENAVAAILSSQTKDKSRSQIKIHVGKWLKKMNMIDSFSLRPIAANRKDYELLVRKTPKSPEVLITDVGFGVSQILPVLVLCYYAPKGSIILLEQPEIHLHPSVQSVLADVFIDVVNNRGVQLIIESHSEHLLRRLQRRIAEEKLASEDAALYFCKMDEDSSKIEKLEVNPYGDICNWPKDFFGDEMDDLVEMTKAKMKRMQQEERHS